jgi:3-phosphoshikimate 1-carboxyvinyltransferase
VRGAEELRVKESDRLATLAVNLGRLGVAVEETPDGLDVTGGPVRGGEVRAADDHRIAMAFALLGTRALGQVTVEEAGGITTSYPGFAEALGELGGDLVESSMIGRP